MPPHISVQPRQRGNTSSFLANKSYSNEEREVYLRDFHETFFGVILDVEDLEQIEELYPVAGQNDTSVHKEDRRQLSQFFQWRGDYEYLIQTGGDRITRSALARLPTDCRFYNRPSTQLIRDVFEYVKHLAAEGRIPFHFTRRNDPEPSYLPGIVLHPHIPHHIFEPCNCSDFNFLEPDSIDWNKFTPYDF